MNNNTNASDTIVIGGGLVKETVTTLPQSELDAMMKSHQPMTLPAR